MSNEKHTLTRDRLVAHLSAPDVYDAPGMDMMLQLVQSIEGKHMDTDKHTQTRDRLVAYLSAPDVYDAPGMDMLLQLVITQIRGCQAAQREQRNLRLRLIDLRNRAFYIANLDADTELASLGVREEAKAMVASFDDLLGIDGWSDRRYAETAGGRDDALR
jgi:hypothetical protein